MGESQVSMVPGFLADVGSSTGRLWEPEHRRYWVGQSPNQAESLEPFTPYQLGLAW